MSDSTEKKLLSWIIVIVTTVNLTLMSFIAYQTDRYYSMAIELNVKQTMIHHDVNNLKSEVEILKGKK